MLGNRRYNKGTSTMEVLLKLLDEWSKKEKR